MLEEPDEEKVEKQDAPKVRGIGKPKLQELEEQDSQRLEGRGGRINTEEQETKRGREIGWERVK